jgi:hypothetical protein
MNYIYIYVFVYLEWLIILLLKKQVIAIIYTCTIYMYHIYAFHIQLSLTTSYCLYMTYVAFGIIVQYQGHTDTINPKRCSILFINLHCTPTLCDGIRLSFVIYFWCVAYNDGTKTVFFWICIEFGNRLIMICL